MELPREARDKTVLHVLVEQFDDPAVNQLQIGQIMQLSGLTQDQVHRALKNLWDTRPQLIRGIMTAELPFPVIVTGVTERGRRLAPDRRLDARSLVDQLLARLQSAADAEQDLEKRSVVQNAATSLTAVNRAILVQVATEAINGSRR